MNDKVRLRMCAGCRKKFHQSKLIRVCRAGDEILLDLNNKSGGRGAYICSKKCLELAEKNRQFNRILKLNVSQKIIDLLYEEFENEKQ